MRHLLLLVMLAVSGFTAETATFSKHSVQVMLSFEAGAPGAGTIVGVFTPDPQHPQPLHLYGLTLPPGGPGIATRLDLPAGSPLTAAGPLTADRDTHVQEGLPVFPPGPVTLRLPVRLPAGSGAPVEATVQVSYLACTASSCLIPVVKGKVTLTVPTWGGERSAASGEPSPATAIDQSELAALVAAEVKRQLPTPAGDIAWKRPRSVAEAEALIKAAPGAVFLDFTGPSCLNCQVMAKTVFRTPEVRAALAQVTAIEIDTDPPHDELASWQQSRFQSQERPLYVILREGKESRWSAVFSPTDSASMTAFTTFIAGGEGRAGTGVGSFWVLAILGGLVTLLMPCTYPMIPFTISFFSKQSAAGHRLLPLALFYGAGIVGCFVGLGVLITGILGANLATLAGHPVTNVVIAGVFVLFGLSLLGVFLLQVPGLGGGRGGYVGALLMGLTFAATAFSCTAPFAGSVLAAAVATGKWSGAILGMGIYGLAIAVPFVLLALSPKALSRLPRSGAWMNELKVVGGLVELAAALKFLVIADYAWSWSLFTRTSTLTAWSVIALLCGLYLLGLIRWKDDERIASVGLVRLTLAGTFLGLAVWFAAGVAGTSLGAVEGLFPGT